MKSDPRNEFGDIEIIYPKRTIEQKRAKLKTLVDPPLSIVKWKRHLNFATEAEIENTYNWLCIVGRIND